MLMILVIKILVGDLEVGFDVVLLRKSCSYLLEVYMLIKVLEWNLVEILVFIICNFELFNRD